jgi:hypothetical protein
MLRILSLPTSGEGGRSAVFAGFFLDPKFEIEGWAADAPGLAVGLAGVRVEAEGGAEFGHPFADPAIEVAAHFVGVAQIFLRVVEQAVAQVVVFLIRAISGPGVVQAADDGFVDGGLVSSFARRVALGAVGDQLLAGRLHALGKHGLEGDGAAGGIGSWKAR